MGTYQCLAPDILSVVVDCEVVDVDEVEIYWRFGFLPSHFNTAFLGCALLTWGVSILM